jgi:hypothetical protein
LSEIKQIFNDKESLIHYSSEQIAWLTKQWQTQTLLHV